MTGDREQMVAVNAAGRQRFPIIYGFMLTGSFTGTGIGVPVWGVVYDLTGEFTLAMDAGGAVGLIGLLVAYLGLHRGLHSIDRRLSRHAHAHSARAARRCSECLATWRCHR